jgi:NAD(P)H dehydrogenase (quinone)
VLLVKSVESVVAVFQQNFPFWSWAAESIERSGTIRLPFADGRTSPVAASDVAEVVAEILRHPSV